MSFICQNPTCAIAISKQEFAKQLYDVLNGNCPGCQQPLVELKVEPLLSEIDEQLIASLPYVIAYPLKETLLQNDFEKRLHRLGYTFINFLKYLGLISISEFLNSDFKNRKIVDLFLSQLSEPSFGKWNAFIRECYAVLQKEKIDLVFPEFYDFYIQIENRDKKFNLAEEIIEDFGEINYSKKNGLSSIGMLIHFRNKYLGHGTPINELKAKELWDFYYPIFQTILLKLIKIPESSLYKRENGIVWKLSSSIVREDNDFNQIVDEEKVWLADGKNRKLSMVPFFIIPSDFGVLKNETQLLVYESYTGNTIKFFSPENIIKETSGEILQRLNLLLRDKQKEIPFTPETFTKEIFLKRIEEENKLILDTLISEKKIIPGVYQHRESIEIKLREWIGARANIFFSAAEAGSGKTNLLAEIQKQYTERNYPGLLIRAGRMEKTTLKEQVAYLLNIDANEGLDKYTSIAGTQAEPTFILIDGLNEANNAEAIWHEILDWSKIIEPGSIKFVVTSRANTKADLERYKTEETDLNFLYGENKDHEKGLGAFAFWLTPLDMNEMKGVWDNYVAKDKSRFKPLFSFDDIATFDRAIYNQINNPLVLRLFLEIYNGKNLPRKGGKHLHIWKDWFNTFSQEVQTFLKLLADEVWLKGENELLLDDLLNNEKLKPYLTSDLVNSPYARMKNMGWVSRYVKDLNGCLGFTVEGALLYLLGVKLQVQVPKIDLSNIQKTLSTGTKLQQSAIESFLCEQTLAGNLDLVTELIDAGTEQIDLCIRPLLYYLKAYGVEAMIEKVLEEPTENDWKALLHLNQILDFLQAYDLQSEFSNKLLIFSEQNKLNVNVELLISVLPMASAEFKNEYVSKIESQKLNNENLESLAFYYTFNGYPKKAVEIYEILFDYNEIIDPNELNKIAVAYHMCEKYVDAKNIYLKALEKILENPKSDSSLMAMLYFNIATIDKSSIENSIEYLKKAIKIGLELYGEIHGDVIDYYVALANCYDSINDIDSKKEIIKKLIKISGKAINNYSINAKLAGYYYSEGDYVKALEYYVKAFNINLFKFGPDNIEVLEALMNLSYCNRNLENYEDELSNLLMAKNIIDKNEIFSNERFLVICNLANVYYYLENYEYAISLYSELFQLIENDKIEGIRNTRDHYSAIFWYSQTLYYNNQINESLTLLKELPDDFKNKKKVTKLMADIYYFLNDFNQAIEHYMKVLPKIKTNIEKISLYENLAGSYQSLLDYDSAINIYIKIIEIAERENLTEELITAYFRKGFCYYELKNNLSAIDSFNLGFKISGRPYFLERLAQCYENENKKNLAFQYYLEYANKVKAEENSNEKEEIEVAIRNTIRLANDLDMANELPDWIKNYSRGGESE